MGKAALAVLAPLGAVILLLAVPRLDRLWMEPALHFYVVSTASLLAAAICAGLIASARTFRETRILFLVLCFFALALIFSVHGLTTPGHLYHHVSAALTRSPWLSTLAAGTFAALSVVSIPSFAERTWLRLPEATLALFAGLIFAYFALSLAFPDWLTGFPTTEAWFRNVLTGVTVLLLAFAAWRYLQSYLFARLPGQLAMAIGLAFLAESQISLGFGDVWYLSWWMYHGLFLAAFLSVLAGWALEVHRARDVRAIADGLVMRDALTQLKRGRPSSVVSLADQIETRDPATFRHVDRVAAYAYAIGRRLGLSAARMRDLVLAAQLHDIGKIGLPSHILTKPGKLTPEEWWIIKQHPAKGWEIVSRAGPMRAIAAIIRHHHERFDGDGYPDGLRGESIPLESRIIAAADTFDALTSERPYRASLTTEEAKAELRRVSGTQLDPACVRALLGVLEGRAPAPAPAHAAPAATITP